MGIRVLVVLFVILIGTFRAEAQEVVKIDGKKYIVHLVEQGQTLYAISKKYGTSVDAIISENPGVETGLSIGQSLRIPYKETDKKVIKQDNLTIDGDTLYHEVVKGETLYSISRKYFISIDDLGRYNPELNDGLKEGMRLLIPYHLSLEVRPKDMNEATADSLMLHTVEAGETLYSLSKKYKVTIDSIQIVNDGLREGLKVGTTIRVPVVNPDYKSEVVVSKSDLEEVVDRSVKIGDELRVAVLAPLFLAANDTIDSIRLKQPYLPKSEAGLHFIFGSKLALDSLVDLGCRMKLTYFDETEQHVLDSLINDSLNGFDLVVGPFYRSNFTAVSDVTKARGVPVISPVPISSKTLLSRPTSYKVYPSYAAHLKVMAKNIADHYLNRQVIIINSGRTKDKVYSDLMIKYVNRERLDHGLDSATVWDSRNLSMESMQDKLEAMNDVILVVPSEDQAYVSRMLTLLNDSYLDNEELNFAVYGMPRWKSFDNIDISVMVNLHVHYTSLQFVDFEQRDVIDFTKEFRKLYHTEPNNYAFLGYDVLLSHIKWMCKEQSLVSDQPYEGMTMDVHYLNMGDANGMENQAVQVIEFNNFKERNRTVHYAE